MSIVETTTPVNSSPCAWVSRGPLPEFLGADITTVVNPDDDESWWDAATARQIPVLVDGRTMTPDEFALFQARCANTISPVLVLLSIDSDLDRWCDAGVEDVIFEDVPHWETLNRLRLASSRTRRNQPSFSGEATKDALTKLPNRSVLDTDHVRFHLCGPSSSGSVAFIDLNGFKGINDTFGHACGDQVLVELANRFRTTVRGRDLIIRWGGDEFLIILPGATKPQAVEPFLNRVRAIAEAPVWLKGREVSLSASCGSAYWGEERSFHEAIALADEAMYKSKRKAFDSVDVVEYAARETHLSLENGRIGVAMQPVFDIHTFQVMSYEALMRFQDSQGILYSAFDVLRSAEQTGMLDAIEACVPQHACRALNGLRTLDLRIPMVSLNFYPTTVMGQGFLTELLTTCESHGIAPHQLVAEFSEDRLTAGWSTCFPFIQELVQHGFGVGLDDCLMKLSLSRLMALPFRYVKVRAEVLRRAYIHDFSAEQVLRAVATIGSTLPLDAIATRIETEDDIRLAKLFNFKQVQGFYFGSSGISLSRADTSFVSEKAPTGSPQGAGFRAIQQTDLLAT
jgi:diguanylate cyclase (GGDEF)-like protein